MTDDTRTVTSQTGGEFYADGRRVYKSPIDITYSDGRRGSSMGFLLCEVNEHVDGGAEYIVKALNAYAAQEPTT